MNDSGFDWKDMFEKARAEFPPEAQQPKQHDSCNRTDLTPFEPRSFDECIGFGVARGDIKRINIIQSNYLRTPRLLPANAKARPDPMEMYVWMFIGCVVFGCVILSVISTWLKFGGA